MTQTPHKKYTIKEQNFFNNNIKPYFNCHCHFFDYSFFPDKLSEHLIKSTTKKSISEKIVRLPLLRFFLWGQGSVFLNSFEDKSFYQVIHNYVNYGIYINNVDMPGYLWMEKTKRKAAQRGYLDYEHIDIYVPLMMDLIPSTKEDEEFDVIGVDPYFEQILKISNVTQKYPWKIFPFVMFDPRRSDAFDIVEMAINHLGFIGVKMYPALGYYPDPGKYLLSPDPQIRDIGKRLEQLYEYCNKNQVPITTHASPGGAYCVTMEKKDEHPYKYTEMNNWEAVLRTYPKLKVNFAHFGGSHLKNQILEENDLLSYKWNEQIIDFITRFNKDYPRIYTDLAFHDNAFIKRKGWSGIIIPRLFFYLISAGISISLIQFVFDLSEMYLKAGIIMTLLGLLPVFCLLIYLFIRLINYLLDKTINYIHSETIDTPYKTSLPEKLFYNLCKKIKDGTNINTIKKEMENYSCLLNVLSLFSRLILDCNLKFKLNDKYFKDLENIINEHKGIEDYILFGTDTPMITGLYDERFYVNKFLKGLKKINNPAGQDLINKFFTQNPIKFLLKYDPINGTRYIPEKYVEFLFKTNKYAKTNPPKWIQ